MLAAGATFDRYRVDAPLGEGGMATVYRVQHVQLGTWHALKVLKTGLGRMNARLIQEGRVQAQLRHPNVVTVSDILEVEGAPGLLMEYVRGPDLDALLEQGTLRLEDADALARGIIAGVAAAHAEGMVHRDLKPSNILLANTRAGLVPKITDFGLAKLLDDESVGTSLTRTGSQMGTPAYMSPEQIRNAKHVDRRTDIFALGAILYELTCGQRAFASEDIVQLFSDIAAGNYPPPRSLCPALPERMEAAIVGALAPDRDKRFASCDELLRVWCGATPAPRAAAGVAAGSALQDRVEALSSAPASGPSSVALAPKPAPPSSRSSETWAGDLEAVQDATDEDLGGRPVSIDVSFWREAPAATQVPVALTVAPPPTPAAAPVPAPVAAPPAPRSQPAVLLIGVVGLCLASVAATAWALRAPDAPVVEPTATAPSLPAADPAAAPAPAKPVEVVGTADPTLPTAAAAVAVEPPAPASPGKAAKVPVTRAPDAPAAALPAASSAVVPAADPAPVAVAAPVTTPAPAPAPAADAIPAGKARVRLDGDAKSVWLQSAGGNFRPGLIPAGTYRIQVFFEGMEPQGVGEFTVASGDDKTIGCHKAISNCKVQ